MINQANAMMASTFTGSHVNMKQVANVLNLVDPKGGFGELQYFCTVVGVTIYYWVMLCDIPML